MIKKTIALLQMSFFISHCSCYLLIFMVSLQTGQLSQAIINATVATSSLYLDGYSSILSTYDAFDLTLSHRFILLKSILVFLIIFLCLQW